MLGTEYDQYAREKPDIKKQNKQNPGQDPVIRESELMIVMDINIPGQKEETFTSGMLSNDTISTDGFSKYPFYTAEMEYPVSILKELTYQEQLNFFFKKANFYSVLKERSEYRKKLMEYRKREMERKIINRNLSQAERKEQYRKKQEKELVKGRERNEIGRKNIMTMLTLIFPTKNYSTTTNTLDSIFRGSSTSIFSLSGLMPIFMSVFMGIEDTAEKYSHINIGGKVYTLTSIIWLNDIYNHPEYKKLVTEYTRFEQFKFDELTRIEDEFDKSFDIYLTTYADQIKAINEINKSSGGSYYDYHDDYRRRSSNHFSQSEELKLLKTNIGKSEYNSLKNVIRALNNLSNFTPVTTIQRVDIFREATAKLLVNAEIIDYLEHPTVILDSNSRENKERINRLRSWPGYNEIQNFLALANQLKTYNSSNIVLQRELDNYVNYSTGDELMKAMNPKNSRDLLKIIDTGIGLYPNTQIYLRVDVIGGKVDDSNKSQIACIFSGENLGNDFEELTKVKNFWELEQNRFYFDMDSETSTVINEMKETVRTTSTKSPDTSSSKESGKEKGKEKESGKEKTEKVRLKKGGKHRKTYRIKNK